jgi:uncharacterized protein
MKDISSHLSLYDKSPLTRLIISLLVVVISGMILTTITFFAGTLIFDIDPATVSNNFLAEAGETNIYFLRYLMIMQDICLFIVPALIILVLLKPPSQNNPVDLKFPSFKDVALVILLAFCIFPLTGLIGKLNSLMHLPVWLSEVEKWMVEKEDYASRITGLLIGSETFSVMMLNLIIVAILPAFGEELIFRGVLQKVLYGFFKSGHAAIWITSIIFGILHFQFFGFLPRFLLGLVFGYLFFWSGTLWLPVIAHFINNAVPVIGAYIHGVQYATSQPDITLWRQIVGLPIPIVAGGLILWYFRNKSSMNTEEELKQSGISGG